MPDPAVTQRREELAQSGYLVVRGTFGCEPLDALVTDLRSAYSALRSQHGVEGKVLSISRHLVEDMGFSDRITALYRNPALVDLAEELLGPDLAMIPFVNLWIGDPDDSSAVTTKPLHQEYWSRRLQPNRSIRSTGLAAV